ncbi:MAG: hypothetical protein ACRD9Q_08915, partial [Nitrososphaeraceae archaeon]
MQSFLLKNRTKKSFAYSIMALKYSTRENYLAALHKFEKFCNQTFQERKTEDIVNELKSLEIPDRDEAY